MDKIANPFAATALPSGTTAKTATTATWCQATAVHLSAQEKQVSNAPNTHMTIPAPFSSLPFIAISELTHPPHVQI